VFPVEDEYLPAVMVAYAMLAVYARILYNHGVPGPLALLLATPLTITTLLAETLTLKKILQHKNHR